MKKKTSGVFKVVTVIFCIYMLILLIPYVYALFASVSTYQEYYFNLFPIPRGGLQWKNYVDAWLNLQHDGTGIPAMIINSLIFSAGPAVLGNFLSACGA